MAASIPLALIAALLFAVSAALQQHSARSTARRMTAGRTPREDEPVSAAVPPRVTGTQTLVVPERTRRPPETKRRRLPLRTIVLLGKLLRDPRWLLGWLAGIAGFGAQAVALHVGSITV